MKAARGTAITSSTGRHANPSVDDPVTSAAAAAAATRL